MSPSYVEVIDFRAILTRRDRLVCRQQFDDVTGKLVPWNLALGHNNHNYRSIHTMQTDG